MLFPDNPGFDLLLVFRGRFLANRGGAPLWVQFSANPGWRLLLPLVGWSLVSPN